MTLSNWEDFGSPWDRMQLGKYTLPGVWAVTSGECARQVDHKKTKDKDGARIKDLGVLPSRFAARGEIIVGWGVDYGVDWETMQEVIAYINPKKKGGLKYPLDIFHPAIAVLGVHTIYVERIRPPEIKDGKMEFTFDMIEWADPKDTKSKKTPDTVVTYNTVTRQWVSRAPDGKGGFTDSPIGATPTDELSYKDAPPSQSATEWDPSAAGNRAHYFDPPPEAGE